MPTQHMNSIGKPPVLRLMVYLQLAGALLALMVWFVDQKTAFSVAAGTSLYVIPQMYFSALAFRYRGSRDSRLIAQSFYRGETGKYILTMIGFACVFASPLAMSPLWVFLSYILALLISTYLVARVVNEG